MQSHTSTGHEQRQSQATCLCRRASAESRREPGNTNSSAAGQGRVKPSQPSVQAVTPAEGPWLNCAHAAKTADRKHLASHSPLGKAGQSSLFCSQRGKNQDLNLPVLLSAAPTAKILLWFLREKKVALKDQEEQQ